MSVICFDRDEIVEVLGMIKYHHEKIAQIIRYSEHYASYFNWFYIHKLNEDNREKLNKEALTSFINRMMWYAFVANKIAYSLQYRRTIDLFQDELNFSDNFKPIPCSEAELFKILGRLIYNIKTNDGNKFMEEKWFNPLENLYDGLAYKLAVGHMNK